MVTGKPPRRSTPPKESVTIDLDARDINPVQPEAAEHTVDPAATVEQPAQDTAPETGLREDDITPTEETRNEDQPAVTPDPAPPAAEDEAPRKEPETPPPATTVNVQKPGTSAMTAAGILGGLVALALAGSMQYAGYLPAPQPQQPQQQPDVAALMAEVDGLKQQLANLPVASSSGTDAGLEARIAALETARSEATQTAPAMDTAAIAALEQRLATLQGGLDETRSAVADNGSNAATLAQRLDDAERKLNEPRDDVEVARAIASAALKATIDRGGPFLTELETLAGVVPDDPAIAALKPLAAAGVPSRAELLRQYPDVANTILEALHRPDPDESVLDRLKGSAMNLVRVRPVGNVAGESPDAVVARIEDKMRNGDLEGALLEWDTLPEAGKSVSASFRQELAARISVENLVNETLQRAVTSTGKQG